MDTIFSAFGPRRMSLPPLLAPEAFQDVAGGIVWNILQFAPPGWKRVSLEYREVGLHRETEAEVELLDGSQVPWDLPEAVLLPLNDLRLGMRSETGTWHRLGMTVEFPTTVVTRDFDWNGEPEFRELCPVGEYRRELYAVYTGGVETPGWLSARAALPKNELSVHTWAPAEGVVPSPAPPPPVQVSAPVPAELAAALLPLLPQDWETASYEVQVLGSIQEHQLLATLGDGTEFAPEVPLGLIEAVGLQRSADYTRERGAWLTLDLALRRDADASMRLDYSTRPMWHEEIPDEVYGEELWFFPRADEAIPTWLRWRAGLGSAESEKPADPAEATDPAAGPQLRRTRDVSRMLTEREGRHPLRPEEIEPVAAFLRGGAAVLRTEAGVRDLLFPDRSDHVPLGFRTDGTWIWSEEAAYYLERDGLPPEPAFLTHIRERGYTAAEVPPEVLTRAYAQLIDWIEGPF